MPDFPGSALFTTNCIQDPQDYDDKVFASGVTGWPGRIHFSTQAYSELIRTVQNMPGYPDSGQVRRATFFWWAVATEPDRGATTNGICGKSPVRYADSVPGLRRIPLFRQKLGTAGGLPRLMEEDLKTVLG